MTRPQMTAAETLAEMVSDMRVEACQGDYSKADEAMMLAEAWSVEAMAGDQAAEIERLRAIVTEHCERDAREWAEIERLRLALVEMQRRTAAARDCLTQDTHTGKAIGHLDAARDVSAAAMRTPPAPVIGQDGEVLHDGTSQEGPSDRAVEMLERARVAAQAEVDGHRAAGREVHGRAPPEGASQVVLDELCNIIRSAPLWAGNTISHGTANECVGRGWAKRNDDGRFVPTNAGLRVINPRQNDLIDMLADAHNECDESRAERDDWRRRCEAAESRSLELIEELDGKAHSMAVCAEEEGRAEGRAAERVDVVAGLKKHSGTMVEYEQQHDRHATWGAACFIERGDHIPAAKPGEPSTVTAGQIDAALALGAHESGAVKCQPCQAGARCAELLRLQARVTDLTNAEDGPPDGPSGATA